MANFPQAAPIGTMNTVGKITVIAVDHNGQVLWGRVELCNSSGEILRTFDGDLALYLNNGQINQLNNILTSIRSRAAREML